MSGLDLSFCRDSAVSAKLYVEELPRNLQENAAGEHVLFSLHFEYDGGENVEEFGDVPGMVTTILAPWPRRG